MNVKSLTRDERFLIKLCEMGESLGDPFQPFSQYKVGQAIGQNDRSVDNIVRMLCQTNFIKKGDGDSIYLTKHGKALIESLSS